MSTDDQWIGNLGHLALADAMLGALLIDMLTILAHARYPDQPGSVDLVATTKQAARELQKVLEADPALFGETAGPWLADVVAATDARNELLHAVALNQCDVCGAASRFMIPARATRSTDLTRPCRN
ncbi:hypothetical protein [Kribbella alba]|uniref:hypothetical protein n=1 Tax=Kribbella alba TaxID=190197 RepID=UPI0031DB3B7A